MEGGIMKILFILGTVFAVFVSSSVIAQIITEEEFIVEGEPVSTQETTTPVVVTPGTTTVVTPTPAAPVVAIPEQEAYVGMSKYHAIQVLGQPTHVEKFRRFTRRHHGIYDEVWTYTGPTGTTVLYIKEKRVEKVEHR